MMYDKVIDIFEDLFVRYPVLDSVRNRIDETFDILVGCYEEGNKLLVAGNGGSASDSEHITGELMKSFCLDRTLDSRLSDNLIKVDKNIGFMLSQKLEKPLTAISLANHTSLNTAFSNDRDADCIFAQQVLGFGRKNDVYLGISTSGNSKNVVYGAVTAKALGMKVIALTGINGGKLSEFADVTVNVPQTQTYKIQELHLPVYHTLCLMLEKYFFV